MYQGIDICDSSDNTVTSNLVGSNTANPGGSDFGVANQGISVETLSRCGNPFFGHTGSRTGNTIGGTPAKGNVVVGSQLNDLALDADGNTVSYNTLRGTKGGAVVQVAGNGNVVAQNTISGGTTSDGTQGNGVVVDSGTGNNLGRNSIHGNETLASTSSPGANDDQPAPALDTASFTGSDLHFTGHYDFPAGTGYEIDILPEPRPVLDGHCPGHALRRRLPCRLDRERPAELQPHGCQRPVPGWGDHGDGHRA